MALAVASSATALAPFSQYSPIPLRSSSGSGQAQLGQSNPSFVFSLLSAFKPRKIPASPKTYCMLLITAGTPAATFFKGPSVNPVNFSGFSADGISFFSSLKT